MTSASILLSSLSGIQAPPRTAGEATRALQLIIPRQAGLSGPGHQVQYQIPLDVLHGFAARRAGELISPAYELVASFRHRRTPAH
jgi:hypothetical protein